MYKQRPNIEPIALFPAFKVYVQQYTGLIRLLLGFRKVEKMFQRTRHVSDSSVSIPMLQKQHSAELIFCSMQSEIKKLSILKAYKAGEKYRDPVLSTTCTAGYISIAGS